MIKVPVRLQYVNEQMHNKNINWGILVLVGSITTIKAGTVLIVSTYQCWFTLRRKLVFLETRTEKDVYAY